MIWKLNIIVLLLISQIEIGVVYNPILDEMFTARNGQGAFCNGKKLHVTSTTGKSVKVVALSRSFVFVGCASVSAFVLDPVFGVLFYIPEGNSLLTTAWPLSPNSSNLQSLLSFHRD